MAYLPNFDPYAIGAGVRSGATAFGGYIADNVSGLANVANVASSPLTSFATALKKPLTAFGRGLRGLPAASTLAVGTANGEWDAALPIAPRTPNYTGGQAQVRAVDNAIIARDEQAAAAQGAQSSEDARAGINYAMAGPGRDGFTLRDLIRGGAAAGTPGAGRTTPGMSFNSDYGYGDVITGTADNNGKVNSFSGVGGGGAGGVAQTLPRIPQGGGVAMAPQITPDLQAARLAAVDRGESIDMGRQEVYASASNPALGALQQHLSDLDSKASPLLSSSSLVDNWRGRQLIRQRNTAAQTGAELLNADTSSQRVGTEAQRAGMEYNLGLRRENTARRGQDLTYNHGLLQDSTTRRGQNFVLGESRMRDDTTRLGQALTLQHGTDTLASGDRRAELQFLPHAADVAIGNMAVKRLAKGGPLAISEAQDINRVRNTVQERQQPQKLIPLLDGRMAQLIDGEVQIIDPKEIGDAAKKAAAATAARGLVKP